jgi:hypothetical protein
METGLSSWKLELYPLIERNIKMTVKEFLDDLDGCGLVITDYDLIENYLKWFDADLDSDIELNGEEL